VSSFPSSPGLTSELVARFTAAQDRWRKTFSANGSPALTPPAGSPQDVGVSSVERWTRFKGGLDERLIGLAFAERGADAPPLDLYRTEAGPHGDVVRATPEFVAYMRRAFSGYGERLPSHVPAPRELASPQGGTIEPIDF
jgi:hypothetical protein